ncbi:hypothetical protein ACI65C_010146 [Semiaphis heraclei]
MKKVTPKVQKCIKLEHSAIQLKSHNHISKSGSTGLGSKRRRVESTRLSNFYVTSTTSAQQEVSAQVTNEAFWRIKYYAVLDSVIENLIRRFSDQSLELA